MNDARPDALLKSALEKIVYFEARSEQLHNDVVSARQERDRLKTELAATGQRELALRQQIAEHEVSLNRAHREIQELGTRLDAFHTERTQLVGKLLEASRLQNGEETPEGFDLASFISDLRGEVLAVKGAAAAQAPVASKMPAAGPAGATAPAFAAAHMTAASSLARTPAPALVAAVAPASGTLTAAHAERLYAEGRLSVSNEQVMALANQASHATRTEETLFGFSVRELSAPDVSARRRAAERLKALGDKAAAPVLATALHTERDSTVQVALLAAFSVLGGKEGTAIVMPLLSSPSPDVRIGVLKALLALDPEKAGPHLTQASEDPDPSVRRRASLLRLSLQDAGSPAPSARKDPDPEVRRLSALALAAAGGDRARGELLELMLDSDLRVRRAAAQSLTRLLGQDVMPLLALEAPERRRALRKLSSAPAAAATRVDTWLENAVKRPMSDEHVAGAVLNELRAAIRGKTPLELSNGASASEDVVGQALALLIARGQVVRRGLKYFTA
ncbi:MAG: HEAT repeat domain-containing protein [Myxococcaceae bacterium]